MVANAVFACFLGILPLFYATLRILTLNPVGLAAIVANDQLSYRMGATTYVDDPTLINYTFL